jgi:hypothetical protein
MAKKQTSFCKSFDHAMKLAWYRIMLSKQLSK